MYGSLDIAVSGMIAERARMAVSSANLANMGAVSLDGNGEPVPFQRRIALFAPGDPSALTPEGRSFGVHLAGIDLDQSPPPLREYDPLSPYAYKTGEHKGWVPTTNVNPVIEQTNSMETERAYEACAVAAETTKSMLAQALRLIA